MKKNTNKGFVLAETLIVTTFVAGILIFLFIQFTNLSKNYSESYKYNNVEDLYALRNIRNYIESDTTALSTIEEEILKKQYIDITDCSIFTEKNYCLKLFELENIKKILISKNDLDKDLFINYHEGFKKFINKINSEGTHKYRLLVEFNNSKYATIRFGE